MGQLPPPIPKVALTIFRLIKLLMCKPKKYVSANQRSSTKAGKKTISYIGTTFYAKVKQHLRDMSHY